MGRVAEVAVVGVAGGGSPGPGPGCPGAGGHRRGAAGPASPPGGNSVVICFPRLRDGCGATSCWVRIRRGRGQPWATRTWPGTWPPPRPATPGPPGASRSPTSTGARASSSRSARSPPQTATIATKPGATIPESCSLTWPKSGTLPAPAPGCHGPPPAPTSSTTSPTSQEGSPAWATPTPSAPECRHDHRLKQHPRWNAEQLPDGTVRWTTLSGRQYTTEPTRYPV